MGRIRTLDADTVGKIAAGEIVEGPSSVVKELVENAVDAGARRVAVAVREGGAAAITVVDDGCGMDPDDVELAFQRHTTSKITRAEDLAAVATMGFRGEALPVIAAVSRVTLVTRPPGGDRGTEICLEGGRILSVKEAGCPPGTTVTVEDLFFNLPPRRKSLRSPRAEASRVARVVSWLILARPEVAFRLQSGEREVLGSPGSGRPLDALVAVVGVGDAALMLGVDRPPVTGYLGEPDLHSRLRSALVTVVNGRPVRDRVVAAAVEDAYRALLPVGRYPVGAVWLELAGEEVDVNVHPAKLTVAHRDPQAVRRAVTAAVLEALDRVPRARRLWPSPLPPQVAEEPISYGRPVQQAIWEEGAGGVDAGAWDFRVIGQAHRSYLVLEGPDGVYLVDQHAAHERVTYEQLAENPAPREGTQLLAIPEVVRLRPEDRGSSDELLELLERAGFVLEPFGGDSLLVRGVPAPVADVAGAEYLREVLENLEGGADPDALRRAMSACRASLKARTILSGEEMEALVRQLGATRRPQTCAHGRPTLLKVGLDELERRFGRA